VPTEASARRPWGVALAAVLALLLGAVVLSGVQTQRRAQQAADARALATAQAAHQQQLLVVARDRAIDAAHRTYLELTILRSALGSVPDPGTQAASERRAQQAFWATARAQSVQQLADVPQVVAADLATAQPRWPDLDRAVRDGLAQIAATQDYLGDLFTRTSGSPAAGAWRDRLAMQARLVAQAQTLAQALGEVCVTGPALDHEHAGECVAILPDLPPANPAGGSSTQASG
jgi:hypothetical protein